MDIKYDNLDYNIEFIIRQKSGRKKEMNRKIKERLNDLEGYFTTYLKKLMS